MFQKVEVRIVNILRSELGSSIFQIHISIIQIPIHQKNHYENHQPKKSVTSDELEISLFDINVKLFAPSNIKKLQNTWKNEPFISYTPYSLIITNLHKTQFEDDPNSSDTNNCKSNNTNSSGVIIN